MNDSNMDSKTEGNLVFDHQDIEKNKNIAGLAYLIFFLPLLACPDSRFGRFHANQALLLLILALAGSIILSLIPIIGWILLPIYSILILILFVMGLVNGLSGKVRRLPVIGKINLLN